MPRHIPALVIPRPKGGISLKGSATTTNTYAVVGTCTRAVTDGKTFHVTKLVLSCNKDAMAKVVFPVGTDISIEYYISAGIPFTDWFAFDDKKCIGDGSKVLRVEGKYPAGGEAGTLFAELVGEEV